MSDSAPVDSSEGDDVTDPYIDPLHRWERLCAGLAGAALCIAGTWAVFRAPNEAGSVFLLLLGGAFLFIGVQGTAVRRLGGDSVGVEMERRRWTRGLRRAEERARSEENPEVAKGIADAVVMIDPSPSPAAVEMQAAFDYELLVQAGFQRIGARIQTHSRRSAIDLTVTLPEHGIVPIDVEIIYRSSNGPFRRGDMAQWQATMSDTVTVPDDGAKPMLFVTNAPLSPDVRAFNESAAIYGRFRAVSFNGALDDEALLRALLHLSRQEDSGDITPPL